MAHEGGSDDAFQVGPAYVEYFWESVVKDPASVTELYNPHSSCVARIEFGAPYGSEHNAMGLANISKKNAMFKDASVKVLAIDCQMSSDKNALVVVTGRISFKPFSSDRSFVQTIVLTQENDNWYPQNDIFRFTGDLVRPTPVASAQPESNAKQASDGNGNKAPVVAEAKVIVPVQSAPAPTPAPKPKAKPAPVVKPAPVAAAAPKQAPAQPKAVGSAPKKAEQQQQQQQQQQDRKPAQSDKRAPRGARNANGVNGARKAGKGGKGGKPQAKKANQPAQPVLVKPVKPSSWAGIAGGNNAPAAPAPAPAPVANGASANGVANKPRQVARKKQHNFKQTGLSVHVATVPQATGEAELRELFSRFGNVTKVQRVANKEYCFIHYDKAEAVDAAIKAKVMLGENSLSIAVAIDRSNYRGRGRRPRHVGGRRQGRGRGRGMGRAHDHSKGQTV